MIAKSPLRILLLEDSAADAELVQDILEADGLLLATSFAFRPVPSS